MIIVQNCAIFLLAAWLMVGCAMLDGSGSKKPSATGFISTPATYYSTAKAKYLGTKYKDNLDRLVERIARDPKTAPLQFANNISSVGGIGFFTHSATKTPDERYLEVVLATPETFETKGEYSEKVHRLFSRYGSELLGILSGDNEIYQDRELSGYGLNLAWHNTINESAGNRVMLARAIVYLPKEKVRSFIRGETNQNELLAGAVIFGEEEDGPLTLVSYRPQVLTADFRPAILEDNLASADELKPSQVPGATAKEPAAKSNPKVEIAKKDSPTAKETPPAAVERQTAVKTPPAAPQKSPASESLRPKDSATDAAEEPSTREADAVAAATVEEKSSVIAESKVVKTDSEKQPNETTDLALGPKVEDLQTPAQATQPEKAAPTKTTLIVAANKSGVETKPIIELPKPTPASEAPQVEAAPGKALPAVEPKASAPVAAKLPGDHLVISSKQQESTQGPSFAVRAESPAPSVEPTPIVTRKQTEPLSAIKPAEATKEETPIVVLPVPAAPVQAKPPAPVSATKSDTQTVEKKAPVEQKTESSALAGEVASAKVGEIPAAKKESISKAAEKTIAPTVTAKAPAKLPVSEEIKPLPLSSVVKTEAPRAEIKTPAAPVVPATPPHEIVREKPAGEQLALLKKPGDSVVENKPAMRPAAKALEGFIIQIAFSDKAKAQHWAETMERRGYAVSVTEAGVEGSLRVRLGNFAVRDDAERQLRAFKQDGMSGIIINLPQGFKPEARSSVP